MQPTAQAWNRNLPLRVCLMGTATLWTVGSKAQADGPTAPVAPPVKTAPALRTPGPPPLVPLLPPRVLIDTDFTVGMVPTQPQHGLNAWATSPCPGAILRVGVMSGSTTTSATKAGNAFSASLFPSSRMDALNASTCCLNSNRKLYSCISGCAARQGYPSSSACGSKASLGATAGRMS